MPKFRVSQVTYFYDIDRKRDRIVLYEREFRDLEAAYFDFVKKNPLHGRNQEAKYYSENEIVTVCLPLAFYHFNEPLKGSIEVYIEIRQI